MLGHYRAGGAVDFGLQLSLVVVLQAEHDETEQATIAITKGALWLQLLAYHALDEAKSGITHVSKGCPKMPLRFAAEQLVLGHLPVRLHGTCVAARCDLAGADVEKQ